MSDYLSLSYQELKQYVKAHPQDEQAFQHLSNIDASEAWSSGKRWRTNRSRA